ncbi:dipeptidase [Eggerthella sp. YY7918]|uniref:dipeptidase n=1 Tax=Eggerthella sp. (strain YY7918) TaxID=502558 RepID=UPI00021715EA|nr:membrane dipeptidase [Eggerthella sp. YY7918]BAK44409.1 Zn-dependent dipeptidase [Eggerthella sp. YY7918]
MTLRVFDLHCDTLDRLAFYGDASVPGGFAEHDAAIPADRMATLADNDAHISLARMAGFAWCQCFAAFIPDVVHGDVAWDLFERVQRVWERELECCTDRLVRAHTMADVETAHAAGKTAGIFTVEGASFLEDNAAAEVRLDALAEAGVRMVTLTWNGPNALGSGNDTTDGLTAFGRVTVRELERRGIVVDVSHLNDEGFKDVCAVAERPFVASHSNARVLCGHPRNLADWQLCELADRGGIVGLNFCRDFLSEVHPDPTPDDVLRHVDHVLEVAGEDVPALGSDYDGCDVPTWLDPCDHIGTLHDLLTHQFGRTVADKLFFENARTFFTRLEG